MRDDERWFRALPRGELRTLIRAIAIAQRRLGERVPGRRGQHGLTREQVAKRGDRSPSWGMPRKDDNLDWDSLSRFSGSVLKRDATSTDYILFPAAAGLLTRIVPVMPIDGDDDWNDVLDLARVVAEESAEGDDAQWATDTERYAKVAKLALSGWPLLETLLPFHYAALQMVAVKRGSASTSNAGAAAAEWLRTRPDASLPMTLLIAAYGTAGAPRKRDESPLSARSTRKIRVELARRLRSAGLTRWPEIVRAAAGAWNVDEVGRLLLDIGASAQALTEAMDAAVEALEDDDEHDAGIAGIPDSTDEAQKERLEQTLDGDDRRAVGQYEGGDTIGLREDLETARARIATLEQQVAALQHERDMNAERHARAESRVDSVTEQRDAARRRIKELEFDLLLSSREREELSRLVFSDETVTPAPAEEAAAALAGRRVMLYTGQAAADAREAMRRAFFDLNAAEVDCYWTEKTLGPDRIAPDRIVVIDVSFMPHSAANRVAVSARRSGAWFCVTRNGAGMIAREVAARLIARGGEAQSETE
jgi:hypothetical protein